jgi:hypothetical protein
LLGEVVAGTGVIERHVRLQGMTVREQQTEIRLLLTEVNPDL